MTPSSATTPDGNSAPCGDDRDAAHRESRAVGSPRRSMVTSLDRMIENGRPLPGSATVGPDRRFEVPFDRDGARQQPRGGRDGRNRGPGSRRGMRATAINAEVDRRPGGNVCTLAKLAATPSSPKTRPERVAVADDSRHSGDVSPGVPGAPAAPRTRRRPFRDVRDHDCVPRAATEHPPRVRAAGISGPAGANVDAVPRSESRGDIRRRSVEKYPTAAAVGGE
jgi:hypothetical protein